MQLNELAQIEFFRLMSAFPYYIYTKYRHSVQIRACKILVDKMVILGYGNIEELN